MVKNQKNKQKKVDMPNTLESENQTQNAKDKIPKIENGENIEEEEEEIDSQIEEKEEKDDKIEENEEEEKKEMREFTIELIIHTMVMDNREEIKKCICRNYIILDEKEKEKDKDKEKNDIQENENIYIEKEIIPSIKIPIIKEALDQKIINQLNNIESSDKFYIKLNDLTKSLQKLGFPLSGSMINIYINYANNYIFFGTEPLDNKTVLYSYMLEPNKDVIKMKIINYIQKRMLDGYSNSIINTYFRKPIQKKLPSLELKTKIFTPSNTNLDYFAEASDSNESSSSLSISYDKDDFDDTPINKNNEKKIKDNFGKMSDSKKRERKIGYIIEKVYAWRKLYNGFKDDKNNFIKYSLDRAAEKIDVSKKSLDDYLLQIRLGRKYGFDFDKNKYKKIGALRDYVKEIKKKEPKLIKRRNFKKKAKKKQIRINNEEDIKIENNQKSEKNIKNENVKLNIKNLRSKESLDLEKTNSKGNVKSISLIGKKRKMKK